MHKNEFENTDLYEFPKQLFMKERVWKFEESKRTGGERETLGKLNPKAEESGWSGVGDLSVTLVECDPQHL